MQSLVNPDCISCITTTSPIKTPSLNQLHHQSQPTSLKFPSKIESFGKGFALKAVSQASKTVDSRPFIVIDNYDSFTYNLCQYVGELGTNFEVYRNDEISVEDLKRKNPKGILISPGPGAPQDSGISLATVLELGPTIPIFGVCMGLQCIGEAFGGKRYLLNSLLLHRYLHVVCSCSEDIITCEKLYPKNEDLVLHMSTNKSEEGNVVRAPNGVMHGKSSSVYYDEIGSNGLFSGLPNPFTAARYHSLVVSRDGFPDELEIIAWTEDGLVMAARHKKYKHLQGVQFHPESVLTPEGMGIIKNFIKTIETN
ncbi:hypothetical protein KSS87_002722 [Heliosperma pusillum]|nr:hypothetical protein KSS87_002722 [Heliosperma pusillum]